MKLRAVEIRNFNSYRSFIVKVHDGLFNVWGLNGQGKTSLQLAIRLGLGWSPASREEEPLENAIHEDEDQARITLVFNNSDSALKGYPEEVKVERRIIRGEAKPRIRMSNPNGDLITLSHQDIREKFSKIGYDPEDSAIFIEQGDLRSFYNISFSALLERCIGLAGLKEINDKVKQTKRTFSQIEETKKESLKTIQEMEDGLNQYKPGYDAHINFTKLDEELNKIELENTAIRYHKKRIESQIAQKDMLEKQDALEKHKKGWELDKKTVDEAKEKIKELTEQKSKLEEQKIGLQETLEKISKEKNQKECEGEDLGNLILRLEDPLIPTSENAKVQLDRVQEELASVYSKHGEKQEELQTIKSQLDAVEKGLTLGIVPQREKTLKQRLTNAGIKTEFLVDCLEIKKGKEAFHEKLEVLLDPFKFYLIIEKKYLQKVIEILKDEKEVGIIVPDDWIPSDYNSQSARDYLTLKECAPKKLSDFLTYFILNRDEGYGPKDRAFLEPSVRFHRIHLSINPKNEYPGKLKV
jgi:chromosome segregation ATPase